MIAAVANLESGDFAVHPPIEPGPVDAAPRSRAVGCLAVTVCVGAVVVSIPLLAYGATARDTIGGINAFATLFALGGGTVAAVGGVVAFIAGRRPRALFVVAALLGLALIVGAVLVFMNREFGMGYGP